MRSLQCCVVFGVLMFGYAACIDVAGRTTGDAGNDTNLDADADSDSESDAGINQEWVAEKTVCKNQIGNQGGFTYEYWKDQGDGCMALGPGGAFSIEWSNINNLLARKGVRPGSMRQIVTYAVDYQPKGISFLTVYGWMTKPLIEYYIVESWGIWRPPGGSHLGTVQSDGGNYDIYVTQRVDKPSIEGTATFYQYWSVRTEKRTSGTISVANHFNAWQSLGLDIGSLYEVSMCVEGVLSTGTANVYRLTMQ